MTAAILDLIPNLTIARSPSVGRNLELVALIALLQVPLARPSTNVEVALHHPSQRVEVTPYWNDEWCRAEICAQDRELPQSLRNPDVLHTIEATGVTPIDDLRMTSSSWNPNGSALHPKGSKPFKRHQRQPTIQDYWTQGDKNTNQQCLVHCELP